MFRSCLKCSIHMNAKIICQYSPKNHCEPLGSLKILYFLNKQNHKFMISPNTCESYEKIKIKKKNKKIKPNCQGIYKKKSWFTIKNVVLNRLNKLQFWYEMKNRCLVNEMINIFRRKQRITKYLYISSHLRDNLKFKQIKAQSTKFARAIELKHIT